MFWESLWEVFKVVAVIVGFFAAVIALFFRGTIVDIWRHYFSPPNPQVSPSTISQLNGLYPQKVKIYGSLRCLPLLEDKGRKVVNKDIAEQAARIRPTLKVNDPHALLDEAPRWSDEPVYIKYKSLDFAELCAFRDKAPAGQWPRVLSTCVLPVHSETRTVFLHRLSNKSVTYPDYLHVFGGGFMPSISTTPGRFDRDLISCARREFEEESGMMFAGNSFPMVAAEELDTGFVHVAFLGVNLDPQEVNRRRANWEGRIVEVHFTEILDWLKDVRWVPTGKLHVLLWLAMGAPGTQRKHWPIQYSPRRIFRMALEHETARLGSS